MNDAADSIYPDQTLDIPCRRYGPGEHHIAPRSIPTEALWVYRELREAGFEAYLVGGCVRDLLLGYEPKDFDVSTNATPEEIRDIFRRSRIVGRRFQIVHVRSGREVIEVSTFRGHHSPDFEPEGEDEQPPEGSAAYAESGMLLRDNVFGNVEEDALRRDFSVNGLYYDPDANCVLDFSTGVADLEARLLRVIGDPVKRFQEDPVRMLRAARFAAKLDFTLHRDTEAPLHGLAYMLDSVPPARLFDETAKLMLAGHAGASLDWLVRLGLLRHLMPDVAAALEEAPDSPGAKLLRLGLENTDQRVRADKSVTPTFLFAVLLWPAILRAAGVPNGPLPADPQLLLTACDDVMGRQLRRITIPKRFGLPMRDLIMLQPRFERRSGRRALRLLEHPKFRAAFDLLLLRAAAGEADPELAQWWTRLQEIPEQERIAAVEGRPAEPGEAPKRRRPRSRRRRSRTPAD